MSKIEELVQLAKKYGMESLAITDHGSMAGLWQAQQLGDKHGVKIIHGTEFYWQRENDGENGHLLVLAKNSTGHENMFLLQEKAYVTNFHKKPRINWELLKAHSEGLIVTSSCLASTYCQLIMNGDVTGAKAWARKFKEHFGDDFYLEVQPNMLMEQQMVNKATARISKELGIKMVGTNDVHYTYKDDCFPHEVLLAMQVKKKLSDEKRFKFDTDDFWFKTEEEMFETFKNTNSLSDAEIKEALENTLEVSRKCTARIHKGRYLAPYHSIPHGMTSDDLLEEEVLEGAKSKGLHKDKDFMDAVKEELKVVSESGYSDYFLNVQDMVRSAEQRKDLVGDGRGSAAGAKIAYLTGITKVPPHEFNLLFERFLAPGREPDIDVDYADQDAVFDDLVRKYGADSVARIAAYGRLTPRANIRKVFTVFGHDMVTIKKATSMVHDLISSLDKAIKANPDVHTHLSKYPKEYEVIKRLDGIIATESQHAGGVLVYPNIGKYVPVKTLRADPTKRIATWDKYMLEEVGQIKYDVLGLATLPVLDGAVKLIKEYEGVDIVLHELPRDDSKVYTMLCNGDVSGVFQLSNQAQKVMEQQPRNFDDIIAINALVRPGVGDWDEYIARRQGKKYDILEVRKPYMYDTFGTMTYQEQFMLDAKHLAGWGLAYADKTLRKNKDIRNDIETRDKFINDSLLRGFKKDDIEKVWEEIENAVDGGYSFNKSHSAAYGQISYQTAWLKANYPLYFYSALMSAEGTDGDGQSAISGYITELKQRGIKLLPPSINDSEERFVPKNGGIAYRITTISKVGEGAVESIKDMRPIRSFYDFLERRDTRKIRKDVIVNLIKAGAFDEFNENRGQVMEEFMRSQLTPTQIKKGVDIEPIPYDDKVKMEWEKEVLGMYLSSHPMEKYGFKPFDSYIDGEYGALVGGEVYERRVFNDKKGNEMAFIFINTLYGNVKVLCFSSSWSVDWVRATQIGNIIMVKGKRSGNDIIANTIEVLESEELPREAVLS